MATTKDVRQFKGQIGGTVRLGADPSTGYVDVTVRVSDTDPRVQPHLDALKDALATIASEQVLGATADTVRRAEERADRWKRRAEAANWMDTAKVQEAGA
jgi:prophage DNA circulation protein